MPIHRPIPLCLCTLVCLVALGFTSNSARAEQPLWLADTGLAGLRPASDVDYPQPVPAKVVITDAAADHQFSPIQLLMDLANRLRDIRYRRGGRDPSTGFDCSGFVRYVFRHGIGVDLPNTSAAQYRSGQAVARSDLRDGDLVFFRTHGKRISHVGIYVGEGQFIHAPSTGKRVSVSSLSTPYWARRFAGAKRPGILAAQDTADLAIQG
ncbi:MAG TPA: C40 family peptidase [Dokdonella sp.]|uniref:C40 family peptidase n=1 Tax=Dokdonella sp. TaxID=2291710 RepID=UPI002D804A41|nr:C40 family peptidase [Dokdonella sp.]HET9033111.1 C40 family peptidase [Dokdonella sp.]